MMSLRFATTNLFIFCISFMSVVIAHNHSTDSTKLDASTENVSKKAVHTCSCGATEHYFFKCCIKLYNKQFPNLALSESNDTEGLSENLLQAIEMLAVQISFVDNDGKVIVPELNVKGHRYLPMVKNSDYMLCKEILRRVDLQATLTAQELYEQWLAELQIMKSAQ